MAPLKIVVVAAALLIGSAADADPIDRWQPIIADAAQRYGLPETLIRSVMRAESGGLATLNGAPITSPAGAMGLMQLMPSTWADMRAALRLGADPYDPRDNIMAGSFYLKQLGERFGYPGMIAAYNAGPERFAAYLRGERRLPSETVAYLNSVTGGEARGLITADTPPRQLLFALRHDVADGAPQQGKAPVESALFAVRRGLP